MLLLLVVGTPPSVLAQDVSTATPTHDHAEETTGWSWNVDGSVFSGYNYQYRKFRDFDRWETQNWWMGMVEHATSTTRIDLQAMVSLEPFTLADVGSPQVFQTGETFRGAPLIDYQHPHDLVMNLGGSMTQSMGATRLHLGAFVVGEPPLGPVAFMHRPSGRDNPQTPLAHHDLDSTHITPGVVRAGVERGGLRLDVGGFHGREPDEDRTDLDLGKIDSLAAQLSWSRGPWSTQVSNAWLTQPEIVTPYDASQTTASVAYFAGDQQHSLAWMAAFGQKREFHGRFNGYVIEGTLRRQANTLYSRAEWVIKDILDAGYHPIGIKHTHRKSPVGALTLGYIRDIAHGRFGAIGLGGDVTGYSVAQNLQGSYGSPWSFHAFLRYQVKPPGAMRHGH